MLNFTCPNELLSLWKGPQWGGKGRGPAGNQECEGVHALKRLQLMFYSGEYVAFLNIGANAKG